MSNIDEVLARDGEAAETAVTPTDGHRPNVNRSVMFSVRLNPDEVEALQRYADQRGLPARTLARAWILEHLRGDSSESNLNRRVSRLEETVFAHDG